MVTNPVRLSETDFPEIIDVWEKSVVVSHCFLKPEEIAFYKPLVLKYALSECMLFGIRENGKLVGFVGIREHKVEMLFIHPESFGKGWGSLLLAFAVKEQGCSLVDVNEENPKAYAFYLKHGFVMFQRDEYDDCGKPHPILHLRRGE